MHNDPDPKENFDLLMSWLGSKGEAPGIKYEQIRKSLVKFFVWRGYWDAEDLADETIDRVTRKVSEIMVDYSGDPALYFYGVAKLLVMERRRQVPLRGDLQLIESRLTAAMEETDSDQVDRKLECLGLCMEELSEENRGLILDYYQEEKRAKIDFRRKIADRLNIDVQALRVRMFRVRAVLFKCMEKCLGNDASAMNRHPKS